jgi:probable phosphoglycerate mutase
VTRLHLVRHGETEWNRELRWQGHSDPPLNEHGRSQARRLAAALARTPFTAVYSSDLRRASETAEIVAAQLGLPVHLDPRLREIDVGSWAGFTLAELEVRFPEAVARWKQTGEHAWEDGESYEDMFTRAREAIAAIAARNDGADVLVVSHGGPIRALKALAAGAAYPGDRRTVPRTDNCGVCVIAIEDGAVRGLD